jgi:hypothetical protein
MKTPQVQWTTPAPLWAGLAASASKPMREAMQQPAILRFSTDTFMQDYINLLTVNPPGLAELWAQPETWRRPMKTPAPVEEVPAFALPMHQQRFLPLKLGSRPRAAAPASVATPVTEAMRPAPQTLKLYQPAQQRFYLISACLVCRLPGMPDKLLNSAEEERVFFVVRRLKPNTPGTTPTVTNSTEYAFVATPSGGRWEPVPNDVRDTLLTGEEPNPLFPCNYNDAGRARRLFSGLVPVARREAYMGAPMTVPAGESESEALPDARKLLLRTTALEPWQRLIDSANDTKRRLDAAEAVADDLTKSRAERLLVEAELRDQILVASWYALLDLNLFFEEHLPNLWARIKDPASTLALTAAETTVLNVLDNMRYNDSASSLSISLLSALRLIIPFADALDSIDIPFNRADYNGGGTRWPTFVFRFADPNPSVASFTFPASAPSVDALENLIAAALPATADALPEIPIAARPLPDARDPGWFVIRCVFERPLCGPISPPVVSRASEVFQMAPFFDPDAPARPIRISLPVDTTPGGLRKFAKNTAFVVSDVLACQMQKTGGLTLGDLVLSVLPWPFHKSLPSDMNKPCQPSGSLDIGLLCSLSIPIITICAFILLMIIVSLFDIIFKWIPYFIICFPLPNFKAKEE